MNKKIAVAAVILGLAGIAVGATRLANGCCPLTGRPMCVKTGEPLSRETPPTSPMGDLSVQAAPGVAAVNFATDSATDTGAGRARCGRRHCGEQRECSEPKCETKAEAPVLPAAQQ